MSAEVLEHYSSRPDAFDPLANHPDPSRLYIESLYQASLLAGREKPFCWELDNYLSEGALHRYRALIDIEAVIHLAENGPFEIPLAEDEKDTLRSLYEPDNFDARTVIRYDHIDYKGEGPLEHDVKANEKYIAERLDEVGLGRLKPWLHYGETSEDTNNLAFNLMLRDAVNNVVVPAVARVGNRLAYFTATFAETPIIGMTHTQNASPTTIGKRVGKNLELTTEVMDELRALQLSGKFSGAVGNHNPWGVLDPDFDIETFARDFVEGFGFTYNAIEDQRNNHLAVTQLLNTLSRVALVTLQTAQNSWLQIRDNVFVQELVKGEKGSSTMSHKINPWRIENSEALFEQARRLIQGAEDGLVISRDDRDLSDHDWQRSFGDMLGRIVAGLNYVTIQLDRLHVDENRAKAMLHNSAEILSELLQTAGRRMGDPEAYDSVVKATQGKRLSLEEVRMIANDLLSAGGAKDRVMATTPSEYIGIASKLARDSVLGWHACRSVIEKGVLDEANTVDAVLFDFDGTLHFGDKDEVFARLSAVADQLGSGFSPEQIEVFVAHSDFRVMRSQMVEAHNLANPTDLITEDDFQVVNDSVSGNFDNLLVAAEYAPEALDRLKEVGKKLGIVTTRGITSLERLIRHHGLSGKLDVLVTREDTEIPKPHPDPVAVALKKLGVEPSRAVFVGNLQTDDIIAGNALGMRTVLVNDGTLHELGARPTYHYTSLRPLIRRFGR